MIREASEINNQPFITMGNIFEGNKNTLEQFNPHKDRPVGGIQLFLKEQQRSSKKISQTNKNIFIANRKPPRKSIFNELVQEKFNIKPS